MRGGSKRSSLTLDNCANGDPHGGQPFCEEERVGNSNDALRDESCRVVHEPCCCVHGHTLDACTPRSNPSLAQGPCRQASPRWFEANHRVLSSSGSLNRNTAVHTHPSSADDHTSDVSTPHRSVTSELQHTNCSASTCLRTDNSYSGIAEPSVGGICFIATARFSITSRHLPNSGFSGTLRESRATRPRTVTWSSWSGSPAHCSSQRWPQP